MLLKGVDKSSWHKRRQRQEWHKYKYIYEIYQIVTCPGRRLMATGCRFPRAPPVARPRARQEIPAVGARHDSGESICSPSAWVPSAVPL